MLSLVLILLAAPNTLTLDVKGASSLRVEVSSDATRLIIEGLGDVDGMTQALSAAGAYVERINDRRVWASISAEDTFSNVRSRGAQIVATIEPRNKPMFDRLREPLPQFASLADGKTFRQADNAIVHGAFEEAAESLATVPSDEPGYPWAQLRLADVAMLSNQTELGCATYVNLARLSLDRTSNVLAGVRARAFGCANAAEVDWPQTLKRARGVDGSTGLWMAYELLAAAEVVRDRGDIDAFLAATRSQGIWPHGTRSIVSGLANRLLSRAANVRGQQPVELAAFVRKHASELNRNADGQTLRLDASRALLDLDLADDAVSVAGPLLQRNLPRMDAPMRTWRILSDAYASRGDSEAGQKLAKAFEERFHEPLEPETRIEKREKNALLNSLSALERRIARLKEHVGGHRP